MKVRHLFGQVALPLFSILSIAGSATQALAASNVFTDSAVYVARQEENGVRLEPAADLARGEKVVTILRWHRLGGEGHFVITNPLPRAIAYQKSSVDGEQVSVDGGRTWGRLETLRLGSRSASPEDVTHVRWIIPARVASKGSGQIAYSGIVR